MFNNLFKHSIRSFKRQRAYIIINIIGLSIGIACSLLIALFVINEASYDRYNKKKDSIVRVVLTGKIGGQELVGAFTCAPIGPTMVREFPEVEDYVRMNGRGPTIIEYNKQTFTEDHFIEADSSFFKIFSIQVIKGDKENILNSPRKVAISESTAQKIFGNEDPIDKPLKIGNDTVRYTVSGVFSDIPLNSHFEANLIGSFMTNQGSRNPVWLSNSYSTYLLLKPNTNYLDVDAKITSLLEKYVGPEVQRFMGITLEDFLAQGNKYGYFLQPLTQVHLDNSIQQQFKPASDPKFLWIFGCIAILIVFIAAINFMNLSTAQSSRRAKEVGIKKIGGSTKGMLITQFLTESFILTFVSLVIAVIVVKVSLPYLSDLIDIDLELKLLKNMFTIPALILFALLVGLLAGSYPAFFLSSFSPYEVLKGEVKNSMKNGRLRKVLVIFQFTVSIILIIGTIIMFRQISFMLNKDVGFSKENLLVINRAEALGTRVKSFKETVKKIPGVVNIASSTAVPGRNNNKNGYGIEGRRDESFLLQTNWIDYDYIDTYGMKIVDGRNFNESYTTDKEACLVNESTIKDFNITDFTQTRFLQPRDSGRFDNRQVTGVVQNFNYESLRNPIQPYIFQFKRDGINWGYLTVKLNGQNIAQTINEIEKVWKEYVADNPLQYYFLNEDFEQMYSQEKQSAKMAVIFSVLAMFIAGLGLFGLTSFTVEQRTKEIGVRKAMGSSVAGIYFEISKEIIILVTISSVLSWPLIYYIAGNWLENFYYRISLGVFSFLAGLIIALGIALLTISYKVIKAARINPARSLKYE